jgi:hypothetical protein
LDVLIDVGIDALELFLVGHPHGGDVGVGGSGEVENEKTRERQNGKRSREHGDRGAASRESLGGHALLLK